VLLSMSNWHSLGARDYIDSPFIAYRIAIHTLIFALNPSSNRKSHTSKHADDRHREPRCSPTSPVPITDSGVNYMRKVAPTCLYIQKGERGHAGPGPIPKCALLTHFRHQDQD